MEDYSTNPLLVIIVFLIFTCVAGVTIAKCRFPVIRIVVVISLILGFRALVPYMLWITPLRMIKGKEGYASYLIEKAGGKTRLNEEAIRLFDEFYKNPKDVLFVSDRSKYPALASFGAAQTIITNGGPCQTSYGAPRACICLRYGKRSLSEFVVIFDPRKTNIRYNSKVLEESSNIFLALH